jgi:hypothetical protein
LLAALVFGSWAAFVNREYGTDIAIRSGLGQAVYALFSTWIVSKTLVSVFSKTQRDVQGAILSFVAAFIVMICIPLTIHYALGTPEILNAILPGAVWGSGYIGSYLWVLSRQPR